MTSSIITFDTYPHFNDASTIQQDLQRISQIRDADRTSLMAMNDQSTYRQAFYPNAREVSANTTFGKFDYHISVDATAGAITIKLPIDTGIATREVIVSKKDSSGNAVTIDGNGKNINGSSTTSAATQYSFKRMQYLPLAGEWRVL